MRVDDLQARFDAALVSLLPKTKDPIGLAVSGGGDSMALLHMCARSDLLQTDQLRVFTVDHRLRAEAAEEAVFVKQVCDTLGVHHETLVWDQPNASQSHARSARHRMLAATLKGGGGQVLLTGHTLSDNVESFLIRARAKSGWFGLAGMPARSISPVWPEGFGIFVARPMLEFTREDVRSWLAEQGHNWRDDPSNENRHYERVRMRGLLAEQPALFNRIAYIQTGLSQLRRAREQHISNWLGRVESSRDGAVTLPLPDLGSEALSQGLSLLCMAVSGTDRPARTARARSAAVKIVDHIVAEKSVNLTLGGVLIQKKQKYIEFSREKNRVYTNIGYTPRQRIKHICAGLNGSGSA